MFGGESTGGGKGIKTKDGLREEIRDRIWGGRMRELVGGDGLVSVVNRRVHFGDT